ASRCRTALPAAAAAAPTVSPVRANAATATAPHTRVGDYTAVTVDPLDGLTFWAANEYQGSAFWNTYVASFNISGASPPSPGNSGGGGPSVYEAEPGYQTSYGITLTGGSRGAPHAAMDGDPN